MERHRWKLGPDAWAEITLTGPLNAQRLEKLKRFVELLEAEMPEPGPPALAPETAALLDIREAT